MREVWLNQKKQAQTSTQMDQMQTTTKTKLLRNKNNLRQSVQHTKFPTMILTTSTVKIAIGSAIFWMCGVYALESLWSHTGTIIFSTKPAFVCYRWILSCCIFHDELLVDCSWGPSFKINVILQGRAAQRQSSLSLFEMIIGPCGITDAGEVGGTDAGADAKRQKYMWIVRQINAK